MGLLVLKGLISGALVVAASEAARRSSTLGAVLASLPLVSILAFIWLYRETRDVEVVSQFSTAVLLVIAPSALLFLVLPMLLRHGVGFYTALAASCAAMSCAYLVYATVLRRYGVGI